MGNSIDSPRTSASDTLEIPPLKLEYDPEVTFSDIGYLARDGPLPAGLRPKHKYVPSIACPDDLMANDALNTSHFDENSFAHLILARPTKTYPFDILSKSRASISAMAAAPQVHKSRPSKLLTAFLTVGTFAACVFAFNSSAAQLLNARLKRLGDSMLENKGYLTPTALERDSRGNLMHPAAMRPQRRQLNSEVSR